MKALSKRGGRMLWSVVLLGATALVWFAPATGPELAVREQPPSSSLPVSASRPLATRENMSGPKVLRIVARDSADTSDETASGLFTTINGNPTVETNVAVVTQTTVAARPQKKSAPPLPFTVLGRYDDQQRTAVYLQHGEQNLVVQTGDKIGSEYLVESLQGSRMVLRYLPGNERQTLDVGGAR